MMHGIAQGRMAYQQELAAKQAAAVEFRDNVFTSSEEPRHVIMEVVSRTIETHGDRIGDILTTVSSFIDRFFGPQPEPGATGVPVPASPGRLSEIDRNLNRNNQLLDELAAKVRLLGDIA